MNLQRYLSRIGLDQIGSVNDSYNLRRLQRQHLLNVPFENLDIHWNIPIVLDTEAFYDKIVGQNRGGFCYELNGLFNELLRAAGFQTRLVSARVYDGRGDFTDEYDHMAILVIIGETNYLADVGFGDFSAEPLKFTVEQEQEDTAGTFMIRRYAGEYFEVAKKEGATWRSSYIFEPFGRDLSEFQSRCFYQQTSPDSHFTKGKLCSVMTENGRKTLTDDKFIVTAEGERTEIGINSQDEFFGILSQEFGIRPANNDAMLVTG
ncbi:MAG: arylamine N-acetyltransferase [Acidobacteriota bacterium]